MILWNCKIDLLGERTALPFLRVVSCELRREANYWHAGKYRQQESHSVFQYTLSGRGCFQDKRGVHSLPMGTGFLCEIYDPETLYFYPQDATEPWIFVYACLEGGNVAELTRDLVRRHGPIYSFSAAHPLIQRMMEFANHCTAPYAMSPAENARQVYDLLLELEASRGEPSGSEPANLLLQRAREMVRASLDVNINATELADQLEVSREHLTRVFRKHMALTPYAFIRREKIREACRLLKEENLSGKETAARLGYDSSAQFVRTFKDLMKMTPTEFRRHGSIPNTW